MPHSERIFWRSSVYPPERLTLWTLGASETGDTREVEYVRAGRAEDRLSVMGRCDSCERPIEGDCYYSAPHAATFCAPCCGAILSAEAERLTEQLRGAIEDAAAGRAEVHRLLTLMREAAKQDPARCKHWISEAVALGALWGTE